MTRQPLWLALLSVVSMASPAWGHGAVVTYEQTITIQARYDNGDPMADAQVVIYGPDDAEAPQQTGKTDASGQFKFAPSEAQPGRWEVVVRQAGHGSSLIVPVGVAAAPQSAPAWGSKLLAGGAVIWGCIGTALFFSRGKGA
ncbi:MAG: carboxypeptidase regulatory-like domain-containing protein [Leptolyngbya sp. SIO4C1]|nr:carboxypeptidase regulatory-like domain-containing protein [Leptolyngbya sp. SIO4C1]